MFLRRCAPIAFSLACIAMVSACGSSSTTTGSTSTTTGSTSTTGSAPSAPAASGATGSACSLVSASDFQSLTGATSATVISDLGAGTGDAQCGWQLKPGAGGAMVEIWTATSAGFEAPVWARFQAMPAVTGVGDEAHWDAATGKLLVKVGAGYALFSVSANGSADETASTNLAKLVVPKLGG